MKVSYNWLKELVNLEGLSLEKIVEELSFHSTEVETIEKVAHGTNLVVGLVLSKEKHPKADKLSVCQVDVGFVKQIVCGAPNVDCGQKVIVALPGAVLPKIEIQESEIRGVKSEGMLCSLAELGLEAKYVPESSSHGIYLLNEDAPIGANALEYLGLDDTTIELGLTPNRMDLLSMVGVANDAKAVLKRELLIDTLGINFSFNSLDEAKDYVDVSIKTPDCIGYYARVIRNIKIKESPNFIKARLIASGIRPINNVVDITNYILMLYGQPLHAFDTNKIGKSIIVRNAKNDEATVTLDGQTRLLRESDVVIASNDEVICLGGVMGCAHTGVDNNTTSVTLEGAVFSGKAIRITSSRLGLRSESSQRFERGVDLNRTLQALNHACYLLEKYADGEVLKGYAHAGLAEISPREIVITQEEIKQTLGTDLNLSVKGALESLGFGVRYGENDPFKPQQMIVTVPTARMDVTSKEDLIEEVARIYGYENLETRLPQMNLGAQLSSSQKRERLIGNTLADFGLNEVITYTLVKENSFFNPGSDIALLHPISEERSVLRQSIIPGLIEVANYNNSHKVKDLSIFEIGKKYFKGEDFTEVKALGLLMRGIFSQTPFQQKKEVVDFYLMKGIIDGLSIRLGWNLSYRKLTQKIPQLHPEQAADIIWLNGSEEIIIGYLGRLHPSVENISDSFVCEIELEELLNSERVTKRFAQINRIPVVERDICLIVDEAISAGQLTRAIKETDSMIESVSVFDVYKSDAMRGKISLAFRIRIASTVTLTEEVINGKIRVILSELERKYQAVLRS